MVGNPKEYMIYEDDEIIVVHKPAGIAVETGRIGQKDMVSILKNYRAKKKEAPYIGVIHRLDQPVEGILLFAKTKEAAAKLSAQSKEQEMDKYYRTVVYNQEGLLLEGEKNTLTDYLLKDGRTNISKVVSKETKNAKKAVLQYEVTKVKGDFAEISVKLETGRHHQIRVQMAHKGLPLVNDAKYGLKEIPLLEGAGKEIALCSVQLRFLHPKTNQKMQFEIEPKNPIFHILQK